MSQDLQLEQVCRRWALLALYVTRDAARRASQHLPIPGLARVAYLSPRGMFLAEHGRHRLADELGRTLGVEQLDLVDLGAAAPDRARRLLEDCTRVWCLDPVACDELLAPGD